MAITKATGPVLGNHPTGSNNVALGDTAFDSVTSGTDNTAIGHAALTANTSAIRNTAEIGRHTSELQSHHDLVCRLLLEKKKKKITKKTTAKKTTNSICPSTHQTTLVTH